MKKQKWSPLDWISKEIEGTDHIRLQNGEFATINWKVQIPYRPFASGQGMHGFIPIVGGITIGRRSDVTYTNVSDPEMPLLKIEKGYNLELLNRIDNTWYRVVTENQSADPKTQVFLFAKSMNQKWVDIPWTEFPKSLALFTSSDFVNENIAKTNPNFSSFYVDPPYSTQEINYSYFGKQFLFWYYLLHGENPTNIYLAFPESEARAFFETYIKPNWTFNDPQIPKDSSQVDSSKIEK